MYLTHRNIRPTDRGRLSDLLTQSYRPLEDLDEYPWIPREDQWKAYDDGVFNEGIHDENTVLFVSEIDTSIVAFASFTISDNEATIGRNAVLPIHSGKGIGTAQVSEIIRRCRKRGVEAIVIWTGDHRFFAPAQRMYTKAGFTEVSRDDDGNNVGRTLIQYRLDL